MFKPLLTLSTCLIMASCTAATPKETAMDATLTLQPEASAAVAPAATLRFDKVEDSRCPPDVRCISAGKLLYHFTLTAPAGKESFALEQDKPTYASSALPGVRIALAPAAPPAARPSTAAGPAPGFPVTVSISRQP
jgi:hypothetical protein